MLLGVSNSQSTTNGGAAAEMLGVPVYWYLRNTTWNYKLGR